MISIIVPVYNVEKYLEECISSIVNQTYKDIEIILVDDGSTDCSGVICDCWKEKDVRIKVYHKTNGGLMSAWKYGVERANGEYIGFVDSDDWIDADMYETMVSYAERANSDLVCVSLQCNYRDGSIKRDLAYLKEGVYSKTEMLKDIFPRLLISKKIHNRLISPNRVTKLFKRDKLLGIIDDCLDNVTIGEDLVTTFNYLQVCNSIYFIENYYPYHYRINVDSMIQKFDVNKYEKIKELRLCLIESNAKYNNYDFTDQINADFIDLMIRNIESHILSGNNKTLKKDILQVWFDPVVQDIVKEVDRRLFRMKTRLYLFLLKQRMLGILILIRRIKKVKKH